jgi:hypothetical protein
MGTILWGRSIPGLAHTRSLEHLFHHPTRSSAHCRLVGFQQDAAFEHSILRLNDEKCALFSMYGLLVNFFIDLAPNTSSNSGVPFLSNRTRRFAVEPRNPNRPSPIQSVSGLITDHFGRGAPLTSQAPVLCSPPASWASPPCGQTAPT